MLKRIIVAAVLSPIALFAMFAKNPYIFIGLAVVFLMIALNELYSMLARKKMKAYAITGNIFSLALYGLAVYGAAAHYYMACLGLFMIALLVQVLASKDEKNLPRVFYTVLPVAYVTVLGTFGIYLRMLPDGSWFIFLLLLFTLVYDSGAYFTGTAFGRHKLIPELSPGKSVEGCIGGLLVNMAVSAIIYYTLIPEGLLGQYGIIHMLILSVILAVNGQAGDIAESVFKRYTGVKNSSNLLSEHGGALDRIDSAMFNAPVLFLYLKLVLHI